MSYKLLQDPNIEDINEIFNNNDMTFTFNPPLKTIEINK